MKVGTKEFTQGASSQYKSITVDEKDNLRQRCLETSTTREIKLEGRRIFKSISLKVSPLCVCVCVVIPLLQGVGFGLS